MNSNNNGKKNSSRLIFLDDDTVIRVNESVGDEKNSSRYIILIVFSAFILRLMFALAVPTMPISDCSWYDRTAISICDGEGFSIDGKPTAYRTPGYSFVLGIIYKIFGKNFLYGYIFNAILGAISVLLLILFAKIFTRKWKIIGWIFALYPEHILYTNILSSEMLFQTLLLLWLLLIVDEKYIKSGILAAIMTYVRPVALLLPLLPILWDKYNWKKHIISFALVILIITPWVIRNDSKLGSPVLTTNFWVNLWIGNSLHSTGKYFDPQFPSVDDELTQEMWFRNELIQDFKENPVENTLVVLKNVFIKLAYFYFPVMTAPVWGLATTLPHKYIFIVEILLSLINTIVVLIAINTIILWIISWVRYLQKPYSFGPDFVIEYIVPIVIYFTAIIAIFFGADRFRFPILPLLIYCAVVGFNRFFSKTQNLY